MNVGDELKLPAGGNVYSIEKVEGRHLLLKCVWFSEREDLGDQIFCTQEGQELWIAVYHARHFDIIAKETPMNVCQTCVHKQNPQGGWCYMFREVPAGDFCAKYTVAAVAGGSFFSGFAPSDLVPGPDSVLKLVNLGLDMYQGAQTKVVETVELAHAAVTETATSAVEAVSPLMTQAGEAAQAGLDAVVSAGSAAGDAVCSVGSTIADIGSGCADIAGSVGDIAGSILD